MKHFKLERKFSSDISIDAEELEKAMSIIGTEKIGVFKKGIIVGNSISGIVFDTERAKDSAPYEDIKPLEDVFRGTFLEGVYKNLKKALKMP